MVAAAPTVVGVTEAAQRLGVHPSTLWEWLRDGAPVARRGRRGRSGVTTLVDLEALCAWRARTAPESAPAASSAHGADSGALSELLAALPEMVADAAWETHRVAVGPHKRPCAGELAAMALRLLGAVSDRVEGVPPMTEGTLPERLKLLRQISP